MQGLWASLPVWERLGEEVKTAGLDLPDWLKSAAPEKLVPSELLQVMISRPELDSYVRRLQLPLVPTWRSRPNLTSTVWH